MKHSIADYVRYDPFFGDESEIRCSEVKVVKTRKVHTCASLDLSHSHIIPVGSLARYEHALVDGHWGQYYLCLPCMDRFIAGEY